MKELMEVNQMVLPLWIIMNQRVRATSSVYKLPKKINWNRSSLLNAAKCHPYKISVLDVLPLNKGYNHVLKP